MTTVVNLAASGRGQPRLWRLKKSKSGYSSTLGEHQDEVRGEPGCSSRLGFRIYKERKLIAGRSATAEEARKVKVAAPPPETPKHKESIIFIKRGEFVLAGATGQALDGFGSE